MTPLGLRGQGRESLCFAAVVTCAVFVAFLILRGIVLYFDHPLETLDGAMQTWFAVNAFAQGQQLGQDFQSYLGVTIMLFLLPFYVLFGSTLFSSSLAASIAMALGLLAMVHGLLRLMRGLTPGLRWWLVAASFAFLAAINELNPGNSLRTVRSALPFLMLPLVLPLLRSLRGGSPLRSGLLLGGGGRRWSDLVKRCRNSRLRCVGLCDPALRDGQVAPDSQGDGVLCGGCGSRRRGHPACRDPRCAKQLVGLQFRRSS